MCPEVPAKPHAHQFRHARASHWLEDGMNVVQVSFLLGHASVTTTMAYLDVTIDSKAAAMDGVGTPAQEKRWKGKESTLREFCGLSSR
jgi:integrase